VRRHRSPWRTLWLVAFIVACFAGWSQAAKHPDTSYRPAPVHKVAAGETCVTIEYDNRSDRHILEHAWDATRNGLPVRLHIDRSGATENRRESLAGVRLWSKLPLTQRVRYNPDTGEFNAKHPYRYATLPHDRDEYPPAMSAEGGNGADVRYVRSEENQRTGREMEKQLTGYKDGQCFQYEEPSR
jgi:hypothetical protein